MDLRELSGKVATASVVRRCEAGKRVREPWPTTSPSLFLFLFLVLFTPTPARGEGGH